jgi:hypothetical protein
MSDIEQVVVAEVKEEVKTDPITDRALEMGWKPETDWEGAPEDFIEAKEFVRRKPLFEKIEHQSKELKQLRVAFEAFKTHHTKVKEGEYQRALKQLKDARRQAMTDGETDRALVIEDKIEEIQEQKQEFDSAQQSTQVDNEPRPEFVRWSNENSWYNKDRAMTSFADRLGVELAQKGWAPEEVLREVTREVKKEFEHKFKNPNRERGSGVESSTRRGSTSTAAFALSDEETQIMNRMVRAGAMTKDEYISELKKVRG